MADSTQNTAPITPVIGGGPVVPPVPTAPVVPVPTAPKPVVPKPTAPKPAPVVSPARNAGRLETYLRPSKTLIDRSKYDATKLADIDENLKNNYIKSDAIKDTDSRWALHTILTGEGQDQDTVVPGARVKIDIDTDSMRANLLAPQYGLSEDDQIRYGRAMQIFDTMEANNFSVMKGPKGTYWLESEENGKRVYASNGILEVVDLIERFNVKKDSSGKVVPEKEVVTDPKRLADQIQKNPNKDLFTESEHWHLAAFGTDLATSLAGVVGKGITAGTAGAGFMAGAVGTGISVTGGLAAMGMSFYGDYLDQDVSAGEMWKNVGIRAGLEAMETATILPLSVMSSLKGVTKTGKILRKGIQAYMLTGVLSTAVGNDWLAIMGKEDHWEMDDYRKMATMAQFMIGATGSAMSRVSTKKQITRDTNKAHETIETFSEGKVPTKKEFQADPKFSNIDRVTTKLRQKTETKAATSTKALIGAANKQKVALRQNTKAAVKEASAVPPAVVGPNGQTKMDFDAPVPAASVPGIVAGHKAKIAEINSKLKADKALVETAKTERIAMLDGRMTAGKDKLLTRLEAKNKEKIDTEFAADGVKNRAALEATVATATKEHGSAIARKLRGRGERESNVSVEAVAKQKQANQAAVVKAETKLEGYAKEKQALEKKLKGVKQKKRTPEDVAEMKRLDEAIVKETKNTTGLRGAGKKLVAKTGAGVTSVKKGATSLLSYVAAVPNAVAASDGVNSRTLYKGFVASDHVDNLTGNRFYQYDLPTAQARLIEEGYTMEEIKKYNLKQLRGALHKIESEKAKTKEEKKPKLVSKKRPKVREFQWGGAMVPAAQWEQKQKEKTANEIKNFSPTYLDNVLSYASTGKPLQPSVWNPSGKPVRSFAPKPAASTGKLTTTTLIDEMSLGKHTDFEIAQIEEEKKKAVDNAAEEDKKELEKKYDAIIASAKKGPEASGTNLTQLANLVSEFKTSDLFNRNRIFIEYPIQEDVRASVLHSRGVRNMPGFNEAVNRSTLQPRVDTADSFAAGMMQKSFHVEGEKRRADLIAKNAGFVENSRAEENAVNNRNIEAENNAQNSNIQRRNQSEAIYANQLAQAKAQKETLDNQRNGRLANAFTSGLTKVYKSNRAEQLTKNFNEAAASKSKWNNEFKPRYDAAVASGDTHKVKQIKSEFITTNMYDPDDLDKQMMDIKAQFRTLE